MNILHLTNSLNPAYGGPAACIPALSSALAAIGHASEIACLDAPYSAFFTEIDTPIHAFGPVRRGFGHSPGLLPWLKIQARAKRFDAVIVHGLWQYPGIAARLAFPSGGAARRVVFPHGMLDPWFKRAQPAKHRVKLLYWLLAERRNLVGSHAVLFTCEEEKRLARSTFPGSSYPSRVVAFGTLAPPDHSDAQRAAFFSAYPDVRYRPFWLFLGRIHPKKGVDLLINAYAVLATAAVSASSDAPSLPRLVIAGPCDDPAYLASLKALAARGCPAGSVVWPGMLSGDVKWGALRAAEAFILPSHQENFGIAVAEALACRTPVLISDQVNIHHEIAADGAGLVAPDTAEGTDRLLRRWIATGPDTRHAMRAAAERCFKTRYELGAVARSLAAALQANAPEKVAS